MDAAFCVAAHAFFAAPGFERPEYNVAGVVCAGEGFAVGRACEGCHVARVASEEAQAVAAADVPHSHGAVAGAGEDVQIIWVEGDAVDVVVVADVDAQGVDAVC